MRRIYQTLVFILLAGCISLTSCVSKGKYLASQGRIQRLMDDSSSTHQQLTACNVQVRNLQDENSGLQAQNSSIQGSLQDLSNKSKMTIAEQAQRLQSLQNLIQSQRDVMNKLRKSIADALVNFKPDELSVYIKDGNVYVSLQEKLLFKSGSAVVDPKGKEALGTLATVLNTTPNITVTIEGHTDTIPINKPKFEDNWALSTGRATAIVRILTEDYGVDPHRVTASGRGEFHPVRTNDTAEGRASNRRTEVILSPNLNELYALLGQ